MNERVYTNGAIHEEDRMIHTDGEQTVSNAPRVTEDNLVIATGARMGTGKTEGYGLVLRDPERPEAGWRALNEQVRDATAQG